MARKKRKHRNFFGSIGRKGLWGGKDKDDGEEEEEEKEDKHEKIILKPRITLSPNITVDTREKESTFWNVVKIMFLIAVLAGAVFFFFVSPYGQIMWSRFSAEGSFFSSLSSLFSSPAQTFGDWRNPTPVRVDEKEDTGIIIKSFEPTRSLYKLDDKTPYVDAVAEGEVVNLKEDLEVEFSCSMDISLATNVLVSVPGKVVVSPNKDYLETAKDIFELEKGDQDFLVNCRILNEDVKKEVESGKIGERTEFAGIIKLKAVSNAQTRSSLRVYTSAKKLSEKELDNFEASLRSDRLWSFNDRVVSITRGGAMDAFIDIKKTPPITETGSYFFTTGLLNTKGWKGNMEKLNDVTLIPAEGRMVIDEEGCQDFENTKLKNDLIDTINNEKCRVESKGGYSSECALVGINVDNIVLSCKVDVQELNPDLGYSLLMADFDYSYAVTTPTTASFQVEKKTQK